MAVPCGIFLCSGPAGFFRVPAARPRSSRPYTGNKQDLSLIHILGNERQSHGVIDWDRTNEEAKKWLDMVAFKEEATRLVKDVGIGAQQLIEIAKALAKNVKLLILDEPTAALPETEARHLLNLLKELQKQGLTSIIITHKLNEVCYVGDRVTIIRDGCTVGGLSEEEKPFLEDIIVKGMVGREMLHRYPERPDHFVKPEVGFEIREWNTFHPTYAEQQIVKNASLKVHKLSLIHIWAAEQEPGHRGAADKIPVTAA